MKKVSARIKRKIKTKFCRDISRMEQQFGNRKVQEKPIKSFKK